MGLMEKLPYKLRVVFAEVANIPSAVGMLPILPLASPKGNDGALLALSAVGTTVALAFGIASAPIVTLCIATPLYLAGRVMQGIIQYNAPLSHRFFKVGYQGE